MSIDFDWQVSEEADLDSSQQETPHHPFPWRWLVATLLAAAVLAGGSWWLLSRPIASEDEVLQTVQLFLDVEQQAVASENGALFQSLQSNTRRWVRTQRLPFIQESIASGRRVVDAELVGGEVWATVEWTGEAGESLRHAAFFEWRDGSLLHTPPDQPYRWADYWGEQQLRIVQEVSLEIYEIDEDWANALGEFVEAKRREICEIGCREDVDLVLSIADGYHTPDISTDGTIAVPSPRLVALTAEGEPAPAFWSLLEREVERALSPRDITFAVPSNLLADFQRRTVGFENVLPDARIQLVPLPHDLAQLDANFFATIDGAYLSPRLDHIEPGWLRPLDDLAALDMSLNITDIYPVALQGSTYDEQLWLLPQSISVPVIYFDERAESLGLMGGGEWLDEWGELIQRTENYRYDWNQSEPARWAYADSEKTSLLAYAMSIQCIDQLNRCSWPLQLEAIATATDWWNSPGVLGARPNFNGLTDSERKSALLALQSPPRRVVAWLDQPSTFEHHQQIAPVGVMALPGLAINDEGNGYARIVPLDVRGGVISASTSRPQIVWAWLKFLSEQRPVGSPRQVPARASVARTTAYWETLPPPLRSVVGESFVDGRAILIAERGIFEEGR